jgi:molybdopterin converting factor small subunit
MRITVKLYGSLCIGRFNSELRDYPDGSTISTIAQDLGLPAEYLIRLRNGCHAPFEEVVQDGDTVSFLPMLDGG